MNLDNLRHSCAHLLAAAIMDLWPNAKLTLGPSIENGFYYDIDFGDEKISDDDLVKIEAKMHEIVKSWNDFEKHVVSKDEALQEFKNNEYKIELIEEHSKDSPELTVYKSGGFRDLCRGGHIDNPSESLRYFKLLSVAGAYWRGDEKNKMLTRIYGTAFNSQKELDEYLEKLEIAKESDHKVLGKKLDLFTFSETVGKGLPLWTPKGASIRREIERFIVDEEIKRGYSHVYTPDIAKLDLYKKSGHYPYYKENMYAPIKIEEDEFMLRPMTCPHHFELYLDKPHSYRDLPIRYAELAKLYRYEKSGELMGLLRVRSFCLADAHIVCRKDQAKDEINSVLDLIDYIAQVFGLIKDKDYSYRLSLGDRNDDKKYFKDDKAWDHAEDILRQVLVDRKSKFVESPGEAAFYGPKIDIQMVNVNGKEDTAFTVQYDFVMPKRFKLEYTNETGEMDEAVVVHRSSVGAIERVIAFLIEKYRGNFPTWLTPIQVKVLPISEKHLDYAKSVVENLRQNNIRVELDDRSERLQAKIRDAQLEKVAYMLIVGDKEVELSSIAVRKRNGEDKGVQKVEDFIKDLKKEIEDKVI